MHTAAYRWAQKIGTVGIWLTAAAINEYFQLVNVNAVLPLFGFGTVATVMAIDRWQRQLAKPT